MAPKKRHVLWLIFILFISTNAFAVSHEINASTTVVDGNSINPGDTIALMTGNREFLLFRNIHGNSANPIVIINNGGQVIIQPTNTVYYGIKFQNCSFIKITGSGNSSHQYGIYIDGADGVNQGTGVTVDNLSTNFEMERVEITDINIAGIYAKTEPFQGDCDNLVTRENFTMYDIRIHDCYIHDIGDEGMYIGSSKYTGQTIYADPNTYPCSGDVVLPHIIEGVRVYNNIVENTGWDGIQVSSASSDCFIYNNTIRNDSYRETDFQMSGILIGGGSDCDCYNNKIFDGKGDGIDILGLGNHKIYNNLIVRPGMSYYPNESPTSNPKHGIWVGTVVTSPNAETLIYNNTIISPKTRGIKLANISISSYKIYNNIISAPSSYSIYGNDSFFDINILITHERTHNLFSNVENDFTFIDPATDNYDIDAFSLAVNTGRNMSEFGLSFDIDNKTRPFGVAFDIGAYESHDPRIGIEEGNLYTNKRIILHNVSPNPISSSAIIKYELKESLFIKLSLINLSGKTVSILVSEMQDAKVYTIEIQKNNLPSGIYFLSLESKYGMISKRIIFI